MAKGGLDAQARQGYALIAPPFLYALLILAAPLLTILAYSFLTDGYLTVVRDFTWANYVQVWTDPIVRTVMLRSLLVSALVTLVTVALAFPVAYYVSFMVRPEKKALWLFLITIPFWTSYLIRVFLWKVILGYNGVVNTVLLDLGLIDEPLTFILYNVNSIVITLAHAYAPFAILPIFVALEKIDRSLLEAGRDLALVNTGDEVAELLMLSGRPLVQAMMMMIPEAWEQHEEMDAARRDFTMNALYADPVDSGLFDYHGGLADLAAEAGIDGIVCSGHEVAAAVAAGGGPPGGPVHLSGSETLASLYGSALAEFGAAHRTHDPDLAARGLACIGRGRA